MISNIPTNVTINNYATQWQQEITHAFSQALVTGNLFREDIQWLGSKTLRIPHLKVSGFKDHDKNTMGFKQGEIELDTHDYIVDNDRSIQFFSDNSDINSTHNAVGHGNILGTFSATQAVSEIDARNFTKLQEIAAEEGNVYEEELNADNAIDRIRDDLVLLRRFGPGTVVYINSFIADHINRSPKHNHIIVTNNNNNSADNRIFNLDGTILKEVYDFTRFATNLDFSNGVKPSENSMLLNYICTNEGAVFATMRYQDAYVFPTGTHPLGSGDLCQLRMQNTLHKFKHLPEGVATVSVSTQTVADAINKRKEQRRKN